MKEIYPVAYQLKLPRAWTIHDTFHNSLLMPYKETPEHGAQFQCLPPDLIDNEEEYEVEDIINHWYHGKHCQLWYLICWKGYSATDDTWEPADQVHADKLVRRYHLKHAKDETKHKNRGQSKAKTAIHFASSCLPPTQHISPLPLPQPSPLTWTQQKLSLSGPKLTPQWSIDKTISWSPLRLWQPPMSLVSCSSPLNQCALLLKDTVPQVGRNSSSLHKDWQELCKRIKKLAATIKNNWKYSTSEEKIWQSMRHTWLTFKRPMSTGRQTMTRGSLTGMQRHKDQRDMRKMKDMSLISSSQSLMVTIPSLSLPHTSSSTDYTAWAPLALVSPSTGMNYSCPSTSPSMRKGSFPTGFSNPSPMTLYTLPCTITTEHRGNGASQLSSKGTMTCTLKLLPWLQSKGAWPLPSRPPKYSWTKASNNCSAHMPMSSTSSSALSMRAPTSTPSQNESSLPSPIACTMVQLGSDWRVMSQSGLHESKTTTEVGEWVCFDPQAW